jgi:hypothetical protein
MYVKVPALMAPNQMRAAVWYVKSFIPLDGFTVEQYDPEHGKTLEWWDFDKKGNVLLPSSV